jgi:hypothetical protein
MATQKRIRRKKKDLMKMSAWPHPPKPGKKAERGELPSAYPPLPVTASYRKPAHKALAHDLPALYHETYLRVIPRDPYSLFTFWETPVPDAADGAPVIRLYKIESGDGETVVGDYTVAKGVRSRYIPVPHPGRRYRLEYGTARTGRFAMLCSSNEVAVPAGRAQEPRSLTNWLMGRHDAAEALAGYSALFLSAAASPQGTADDMAGLIAGL